MDRRRSWRRLSRINWNEVRVRGRAWTIDIKINILTDLREDLRVNGQMKNYFSELTGVHAVQGQRLFQNT